MATKEAARQAAESEGPWINTTAERDGGILVSANRPAPGYKLVTSERLVMPAGDEVQRLTILGILDRLPVLERRNRE